MTPVAYLRKRVSILGWVCAADTCFTIGLLALATAHPNIRYTVLATISTAGTAFGIYCYNRASKLLRRMQETEKEEARK